MITPFWKESWHNFSTESCSCAVPVEAKALCMFVRTLSWLSGKSKVAHLIQNSWSWLPILGRKVDSEAGNQACFSKQEPINHSTKDLKTEGMESATSPVQRFNANLDLSPRHLSTWFWKLPGKALKMLQKHWIASVIACLSSCSDTNTEFVNSFWAHSLKTLPSPLHCFNILPKVSSTVAFAKARLRTACLIQYGNMKQCSIHEIYLPFLIFDHVEM